MLGSESRRDGGLAQIAIFFSNEAACFPFVIAV